MGEILTITELAALLKMSKGQMSQPPATRRVSNCAQTDNSLSAKIVEPTQARRESVCVSTSPPQQQIAKPLAPVYNCFLGTSGEVVW